MGESTKLFRKTAIAAGVAALCVPIWFAGCGGGDDGDGGGGGDGDTSQINVTTTTDALGWIEDTVPGCTVVTQAQPTGLTGKETTAESLDVLKRIVASMKEARDVSSGRMQAQAAEVYNGECGGTLTMDSVHANGDTTYTMVFNNYCSTDDSVSPPQNSTVSGSVSMLEDGTPTASGPLVSSMTANVNQLTVVSKGETTRVSVTNMKVTYGVPGIDGPGDATSSNPDRIGLTSMAIDYVSQGRNHSLTNFSATTYGSGDNTVMNIASGHYVTTNHGAIDLRTPTPLVMNEDGDLVSGSLTITGDEGVVQVVPGASYGVFDILVNGAPLNADLDCSGAGGMVGEGAPI